MDAEGGRGVGIGGFGVQGVQGLGLRFSVQGMALLFLHGFELGTYCCNIGGFKSRAASG